MLHIAVINESDAASDSDIEAMLPAFKTQWNRDLDPIWGVGTANFSFVPRQVAPQAGAWWVVFLNDSNQATDLAYHDLTNEGLPISKVFVDDPQSGSRATGNGVSHQAHSHQSRGSLTMMALAADKACAFA